MTVLLVIHYIAIEVDTKIMRKWETPLRGKKPEEVALKWWKEIIREYHIDLELEKVTSDGEDITELVNELRS
ncbi:hypothetical protein QNH48_14985 [Neobacillus sp. YX16]|uniref:hypothetical protein n=1 Tax=Neobacillus sp. YX16 TaxID=3047874 RepID=UPI0024C36F10|nr:hypothetical protein [Neobacillus sp. YX16]WHZ05844.1 hypothetical protein QNH48_14985 [Neobacillus sp. YX16]